MRIPGLSLLLCVALGCTSSTQAKKPPAVDSAADDSALQGFMKEHATKGAGMRKSIIQARLDKVREHAGWFLKHLDAPEVPLGWSDHKDAMHDAAERAAFTVDVDVAAKALADLAGECGACHDALGGPDVKVKAAPTDDGSIKQRMLRHQWAAGRLWDGLIGPSTDAWRQGAEVLAASPLTIDKISVTGSEAEVEELMREVHVIARRSKSSEQLDERRMLFGELLTRCGKCHEMFGKGKR